MAQKAHGESLSKVTAPPNLPIFFLFFFYRRNVNLLIPRTGKTKEEVEEIIKIVTHICAKTEESTLKSVICLIRTKGLQHFPSWQK